MLRRCMYNLLDHGRMRPHGADRKQITRGQRVPHLAGRAEDHAVLPCGEEGGSTNCMFGVGLGEPCWFWTFRNICDHVSYLENGWSRCPRFVRPVGISLLMLSSSRKIREPIRASRRAFLNWSELGVKSEGEIDVDRLETCGKRRSRKPGWVR